MPSVGFRELEKNDLPLTFPQPVLHGGRGEGIILKKKLNYRLPQAAFILNWFLSNYQFSVWASFANFSVFQSFCFQERHLIVKASARFAEQKKRTDLSNFCPNLDLKKRSQKSCSWRWFRGSHAACKGVHLFCPREWKVSWTLYIDGVHNVGLRHWLQFKAE